MDDTENTPAPPSEPVGGGDTSQDQDSEPTLNAPEEDRPDGLAALDDEDDSESTGGEGTPS